MRNDKLIPGLILVLIGGVILLDNFGYIDFDWGDIWHLWPLFLIIAGVNLVFANNRSPVATVLKISVVIIGFIFLLFAFGNMGSRFGYSAYHGWHHHNRDNDDNSDSDDNDDDDDDTAGTKGIVKIESNKNFTVPYDVNAKIAQLNISGGGTKYILNDTTNQLFKADTKEHYGDYEFSHHNNGSTYVLDFDLKDKKGHSFNLDMGDDKSNSATFRLNTNPLWDIDVEAGAMDLNFDLTKFKIRTLKLDGGAAAFQVKLGQPVIGDSNIKVSTGMASVNIDIPQAAACQIITDSGLSSNSFDGFTKKGDGNYETPGFDSAKNKIIINIDGGLSSFNVTRY